MSKALRRYPDHEEAAVISRRLAGKTMGLGYWAAVDARKRREEVKEVKKEESND